MPNSNDRAYHFRLSVTMSHELGVSNDQLDEEVMGEDEGEVRMQHMRRLGEMVDYLRDLREARQQEHPDLPTDTDLVHGLGIDVVHEVYPRVYLGGRRAATDGALHRRLALTHLLNAAHPGGRSSTEVDCTHVREGVTYLGLPLSDEHTENVLAVFGQTGEWIDRALEQEEARVLVNCWRGVSRSGL